jgi:hypothetical protein
MALSTRPFRLSDTSALMVGSIRNPAQRHQWAGPGHSCRDKGPRIVDNRFFFFKMTSMPATVSDAKAVEIESC